MNSGYSSMASPDKTFLREEELLPVSIEAVQAEFELSKGEWEIEAPDNKVKTTQLQNLNRREELRQAFLMHMLADKEVKLSKTRSEIAKMLIDDKELLEIHGFPAKELIENTNAKQIYENEFISPSGSYQATEESKS